MIYEGRYLLRSPALVNLKRTLISMVVIVLSISNPFLDI